MLKLFLFVSAILAVSQGEDRVAFLGSILNKAMDIGKDLSGMMAQSSEKQDLVNIDGWVLLFRGTADINKPIYELWMNNSIFHEPSSIAPGCLTLRTSLHCKQHFRSKLISQWELANIKLVKYLILKDDTIRAEILFDAVGSDKTNWFSSSRVLNSSWTDLKTSSFNFFSLEGDRNLSNRRFFINHNYGGCAVDNGWTTVLDRNGRKVCDWDTIPSYPRFLFSTKPTRSLVHKDHDVGDALVILAKINE